jgi:cytochrome o ubiquinol oxidase subunit 3
MHKEHSKDKVFFGFWIYMMTDLLMFAVLFATFTVLRNNTNGGIGIGEIFNPPFVLAETLILLASSFTCGLALLALNKRDKTKTMLQLGITALLGIVFLGMELYEFSHLISEGHDYTKSAFLSSFFTLLSFHGLHILAGTFWIVSLLVHIKLFGFSETNTRKVQLLTIFWHFLDVVWIFIFTIVYLMGGIL